jgi:hypothetical protein
MRLEHSWATSITHHIRRATKPVAVALALFGIAASQPEPRVIDLTKAPARSRRSLGVAAASVGGAAGQPAARPYALPIQVNIISLERRVGSSRLIVELEVENTGHADFLLPVEVDQVDAHNARTGRKSFAFNLEYTADRSSPVVEAAEVTFSSNDSPSTFVSIRPGGRLVVRFAGTVPALIAESKNTKGVHVRVTCQEVEYSDGSLRVAALSAKTMSGAKPLSVSGAPQ